MSTYKEEVEEDVGYMGNYYEAVDQIYDKGGLTLVSNQYIKWARYIVSFVNEHINQIKILAKKNRVMGDAKNNIQGNVGLYKLFKKVTVAIPDMEETIVRLVHVKLVLKMMNARAGTIFKQFHDHFIGNYSKPFNVEFRKSLQVTTKKFKHSTDPKKKRKRTHTNKITVF